MKKLSLALLTLAVAALSGCGAAGCTSSAAEVAAPGKSCTVSPGSTVTVSIGLNCKCTDTSASCQSEWRTTQLEVAPTVQQCSDQASCATSGCDVSGKTATCTATIPADAAAGTVPIVDGSGTTIGQVTVGSSGSSSCAL